jgi:hypothetical protein
MHAALEALEQRACAADARICAFVVARGADHPFRAGVQQRMSVGRRLLDAASKRRMSLGSLV